MFQMCNVLFCAPLQVSRIWGQKIVPHLQNLGAAPIEMTGNYDQRKCYDFKSKSESFSNVKNMLSSC